MSIAIIGLGLIGGSLGLALKRSTPAGLDTVGYAPHPETVALAQRLGAVSRTAASPEEAVQGAAVVILSTPVLAIKGLLERIAPHLPPGCLVTDTASTKVQVMAWAQEYLPAGVDFVGGHPMAGKESRGIQVAEPGLFQGCCYCLTPAPHTSPQAVQKMVKLVEQIGARPCFIEAAEHDYVVAAISHLPALLSSALVWLTTQDPSWPKMAQLAAGGYRDLSRLASGDPRMMRDICLTNRDSIASWIDRFIQGLGQFKDWLAQDEALEAALSRAKEARDSWLKGRG
ncbi:MAG TPA: prephenate dehydrogenase [Dehalococcoidia bacterium]|nr:prephenate dehydrogenase [Dehalococcoidia bacterium]